MTGRGASSRARRDAIGKTRRFNELKSQTRENGKTTDGDTERRNRRKAGRTYRKRVCLTVSKRLPRKVFKRFPRQVFKRLSGKAFRQERTVSHAKRTETPRTREEEKPHASALHDSGKQARRCLPAPRHDRRGDWRGEREAGRGGDTREP